MDLQRGTTDHPWFLSPITGQRDQAVTAGDDGKAGPQPPAPCATPPRPPHRTGEIGIIVGRQVGEQIMVAFQRQYRVMMVKCPGSHTKNGNRGVMT